jgi:hypothetical protein
MRKIRRTVGFLFVTLLAGCAAHYTPESVHSPYGFFSGLWHGFFFPWALLTNLVSWFLGLFGISLFESIQIIGRPNTGFFWYYVGFIFGLGSYSQA